MSVSSNSSIRNGIFRGISGRKGTVMTCENRSGSAIENDSRRVILNALSEAGDIAGPDHELRTASVSTERFATDRFNSFRKNNAHQDKDVDDANTNKAPNINTSSFKRVQLSGSFGRDFGGNGISQAVFRLEN